MSFEIIDSKTVFDGKIIKVNTDTVALPNGSAAYREKICTTDGVAVLVLNENDELILVKQHRYAMDIYTLEIPAGKVEAGEDIYESALRELREETGYQASNLTKLAPVMAMPAICTETVHIFYADSKDLTFVGTDFDEEEFIDQVAIPFERAVKMVLEGEICDAKTVSAILQLYVLRSNK